MSDVAKAFIKVTFTGISPLDLFTRFLILLMLVAAFYG